jgi:hypothetical protein
MHVKPSVHARRLNWDGIHFSGTNRSLQAARSSGGRKQQARLASCDSFDRSHAGQDAIEFLEVGAFDFRDEVEWTIGAVEGMDLRQSAQRMSHAAGILAGDFDHHDRPDAIRRGWVLQPNGKAKDHVGSDQLVEPVLNRSARDSQRFCELRQGGARIGPQQSDQSMVEVVHGAGVVIFANTYGRNGKSRSVLTIYGDFGWRRRDLGFLRSQSMENAWSRF